MNRRRLPEGRPVTHLKQDQDLDALRDRDDFKKLLVELEGKGK